MQKILNNKSFDELKTWKDLVNHQKKIKDKSILDHFKNEKPEVLQNIKEWFINYKGKNIVSLLILSLMRKQIL